MTLDVSAPVDTGRADTPEPQTLPWLAATSVAKSALDAPGGWFQTALARESTRPKVQVMQFAFSSLTPGERRETQTFSRHRLGAAAGRVRPLALPADAYAWADMDWSALIKSDKHVVAHAGVIYRVIQVGNVRVPVGGIGAVMTTAEWRGRGYARAVLASATAFVGTQLWAPFALVICPADAAGLYVHLGWRAAAADVWCDQGGRKVRLHDEVALYTPCQGDAVWPSGTIDLQGNPW